tara:strand:+ start:91 stop:480 length:390 start_codon:yes stop_codon:yes gene_type:complete
MTKHRRFSDKPKDDFIENEGKIELEEEENSTPKNVMDIKSLLLSGSKYVYIIAIAALLSGVFTPITLGIELEVVIFGILTILLGLGGGVLILLGIKNQKSTTLLVCTGIGLIFASMIIMYELTNWSLFT